jgi:hypothetical protein
MNIEMIRGIDYRNRVRGYDHEEFNFITWGLWHGVIVVVDVVEDESSGVTGSTRETLKNARLIAAEENEKSHSALWSAIHHSGVGVVDPDEFELVRKKN